MLYIVYGNLEIFNKEHNTNYESLYRIDSYFDTVFTNDWLNDEYVEKMILDVDKSTHIKDSVIDSQVLGIIPPQYLSSGLKTLISMYKSTDDIIWDITNCGNNCAKWIFDISIKRGIVVNLEYFMEFEKVENFNAVLMNNNQTYTNWEKMKIDIVELIFK